MLFHKLFKKKAPQKDLQTISDSGSPASGPADHDVEPENDPLLRGPEPHPAGPAGTAEAVGLLVDEYLSSVDVEEINGSDLDVYIYACQGRILESLNIQTAEDLRRAKWEVANRKAEYSRMEGELQELEAYDRKLACLLNIYGKQVDFYVPEAEMSENQ